MEWTTEQMRKRLEVGTLGNTYDPSIDPDKVAEVLLEIAVAVAELKETECGNSGKNWVDRLLDRYRP